MRRTFYLLPFALCLFVDCRSGAGRAGRADTRLRLRPSAHDTYNGMGTASDGRIYYVLSSESFDVGAQMFCYDPATDKIEHVGDITEACGEKDARTIVQGKSHVNFVERDGKLYFATHVGYYSIIDGMEKIGIPPEGWKPYPGGHFLAYDMKAKKFEDLGQGPARRRHPHHDDGHEARPALRPHLARRALPPLRSGEEGTEGPRADLPGGRERQGRAVPHALPLVRGRSAGRQRLLHRRRRRDLPLPRTTATRSRS